MCCIAVLKGRKKKEASAGSGGTATKRTRRWWEPVIADCGCEYKLGERLRSQLSMEHRMFQNLFPIKFFLEPPLPFDIGGNLYQDYTMKSGIV